jgi:hypothetical protein
MNLATDMEVKVTSDLKYKTDSAPFIII